jgi:hypothetical protein
MKNKRLKIQILLVLITAVCMYVMGKQIANWNELNTGFQKSEQALQQAATAPQTLRRQAQQLTVLTAASEKQQAATRSGGKLLSYVEAACRAQGVTLLSLPQERQLSQSGNRLSELRFSLEGRLQDILALSHRWEYRDRLGRLTYFKLARENIRSGRKREAKLVASLRFKRLL